MELIDKDYFIGAMEESKKIHGEYSVSINNFINSLKSAPTVDAVKVVRCRDCKYWMNYTETDVPCCKQYNGLQGVVLGDDFCSYGERKESTCQQL